MNGSPRKSKASKALTIQADTEAPADGVLDPERDMAGPKRLGSVRFAQHLQPDSPTPSSVIGGLACECSPVHQAQHRILHKAEALATSSKKECQVPARQYLLWPNQPGLLLETLLAATATCTRHSTLLSRTKRAAKSCTVLCTCMSMIVRPGPGCRQMPEQVKH